MSPKGKRGNAALRAAGRPVIVLAGEDQNDCEILAALLRAHRPDLAAASKLVRVNDPVRLRKKSGADLSCAVKTLLGKARAKARQQQATLHGIVVHEDLDAVTDSRYETVRKTVAEQLARQSGSFESAFALAAWESEAWLLLFPAAFPHVRRRWAVPAKLRGKDTGRIKEPKEELKRGLRTPEFRESDGPLIARAALEHGLITAPEGSNRSFDDFLDELDAWA